VTEPLWSRRARAALTANRRGHSTGEVGAPTILILGFRNCTQRPTARVRPATVSIVRHFSLGLAVVALAACGLASDTTSPEAPTAPLFELTTLDGDRVTLDDLHGKAVVLNFWASWCVPCRSEMPYFEKTYRAYHDRGVVFVGAAVEDDLSSARAFVKELGVTYPVGLDEGGVVTRAYQVAGLPSTFIIDRNGGLVRKWPGVISEDQLAALVEQVAE